VVQNTRKALHPGALKPLNLPESITVRENPAGLPAQIEAGRRQSVDSVEDSWRIEDEWWRQRPTSRLYFAVRLAEGRRLVIFKDLVDGRWYRQSY
jgi:hypothetical protein